MKIFLRNKLHFFTLVLLGLITHGMLLLNDGIYWESWNDHTHFVTLGGNPNVNRVLITEANQLSHVIYRDLVAFFFTDINFGFKFLSLINIILSATLVYVLISYISIIDRNLRLWLSAFIITIPTQTLGVDYVFSRYMTDLTIFYGATLCAIYANNKTYSQPWRLSIRIVALCSYFLSFYTGSLLVYYLIAYCYIIFVVIQPLDSIYALSRLQCLKYISITLFKNVDFLLLPILFWIVNRFIFPSTAEWVTAVKYNQIDLSLLFRYDIWINYFYTGTIALVKNGLQLSLAPLFFIILILIYGFKQVQNKQFKHNLFWGAKVLSLGLITLALGTLPYIAVGRDLVTNTIFSYFMRYFLLYPLPIAICCISFSRLFSKYTLLVILLSFSFTTIDLYFIYQSRFVKDLSVRQNILATNQLNLFSIVRISDQYPLDARFPAYFGQDTFFEKTAYLRWVLNGPKWPVVAQFVDGQILEKNSVIAMWLSSSPIINEYFHYHKLDILGCYGQLVISKTDYAQTLTPVGISLRYWYYRFLKPNQLNTWASTLSLVQLTKIEMPMAIHCT